ncbi:MAG: class I SAM-dependent DNA methyltransferase [Polaromonas sp.]|nr:class I SAM-dependent DNA methyltransferase [Polaromonas sp.]
MHEAAPTSANTSPATDLASAFIARWQGVAASELSTAQSFVTQLCELLGVPATHPTPEQNYMFERPITFSHGDGSTSGGRIDCYRHGHFVLEAKKLKAASHTRGFDDALLRARAQAEGYARALPATEGRPPFLLVVDVGTVIELYSEFTRSGATYTPFPDPRSHRIALAELAKPEVRARLRLIWTDPLALDPARLSARITREVAAQLAELARSLEQSGHRADHVGAFLTRSLFSMFAEDVELLPKGSFLKLLQNHKADPRALQGMLQALWTDMDHGGFSVALATQILRFNGKLFKQPMQDGYSLILNREQIDRLISAAKANWREVEPAIFGTLLERALSPTERHALGAHYTPRAYVERLVLPTVVEPLRADWANVQAAAVLLASEAAELSGKAHEQKMLEARTEIRKFHHQLCSLRVLDPACGSGNFLYVTLEHLKRLEGEVINQLEAFGETQSTLGLEGETVSPQQLLGIELNERAAALAELVLWIGYLQWHIRTRGNKAVAEPVVHDYGNIEQRDAVLAWSDIDLARDANGQTLMRWDGRTKKVHPVTGALVPDDTAQTPQWHYINAKQAKWPKATYIIGNPPYLGARTIRSALGDGYLNAIRGAYPGVPENADYVMYWWDRAASQVSSGNTRRFGLITTNSLRQTFNRAVVEKHLAGKLSLAYVVPDHPWVDSSDGADVRVALSVVVKGSKPGRLLEVVGESPLQDGEVAVDLSERIGLISPGLTVDLDIAAAPSLRANDGMSCVGYQLTGKGFVVGEAQARQLDPDFGTTAALIRPLVSGRDITQETRKLFAIDLFGLGELELRTQRPAIYQWVSDRVKGERDLNVDSSSNKQWWLFARPRAEFRLTLNGCTRVITTSLTAKHRLFVLAAARTICDSTTVMFALPDAFHLGVLSSNSHVAWSLASNNRMGVGNDPRYIKTVCFENFPFPDEDTGLTPELKSHIAALAEQIDAHRKRQQAAHPGLTLTGMYNVLEILRSFDGLRTNGDGGARPLTDKEKTIHTQGLVGVLKELHDELDAAVLQAYGLEAGLNESENKDALLSHLVSLNAQRALEEKTGKVRWLRPEFQNPVAYKVLQNQEQPKLVLIGQQADLIEKTSPKVATGSKTDAQPWPATLPEQVRAVAQVLASAGMPLSLSALEARFKGKGPWKKGLPRLLETLEALGRARREGADWRG